MPSDPPCSTLTLHSDTMPHLLTIFYHAHHMQVAPSTMFTIVSNAHCAYQAPFPSPTIPAILYHATSTSTMFHCNTMPYQPTMIYLAPCLTITMLSVPTLPRDTLHVHFIPPRSTLPPNVHHTPLNSSKPIHLKSSMSSMVPTIPSSTRVVAGGMMRSYPKLSP